VAVSVGVGLLVGVLVGVGVGVSVGVGVGVCVGVGVNVSVGVGVSVAAVIVRATSVPAFSSGERPQPDTKTTRIARLTTVCVFLMSFLLLQWFCPAKEQLSVLVGYLITASG
jgi:hypothetical protein